MNDEQIASLLKEVLIKGLSFNISTAVQLTELQDQRLAQLERELQDAHVRIELLEHDMHSGDYEALYALTVQELVDSRKLLEESHVTWKLQADEDREQIIELQAKQNLLSTCADQVIECLLFKSTWRRDTSQVQVTFDQIECLRDTLATVDTHHNLMDSVINAAKSLALLKATEPLLDFDGYIDSRFIIDFLKTTAKIYADRV